MISFIIHPSYFSIFVDAMNFKTTIILLILLAGAGTYLFLTRSQTETKTETANPGEGTKLVDIDAKDVTKVTVTPTDEPKFVIEKTGTDWQITEPVKAPAESFEVESLVRAVTDA